MESAYVHVALSVVVEAEQHQALPSAFAATPETLQSASPALEISQIFRYSLSDLDHSPTLRRDHRKTILLNNCVFRFGKFSRVECQAL